MALSSPVADQQAAYARFLAGRAQEAHRKLANLLDLIEDSYDGLRREELRPVLRALEDTLYSPTFDPLDGSMWVRNVRIWPEL